MSHGPVFREDVSWGETLPDLRGHDVSDIAVDARDDVHLLYRDPSFIVVAAADGTQRRIVAAGVLGRRPHGITVDPDGGWYVVEEADHCVRLLDREGRQVSAFGSGPSNPEFATPVSGDYWKHVAKGYPPFTRPARIAIAPWGDRYVADGYGNCRVHRFSERGELLGSWGEPGTGPGQMNLPHEVTVDRAGRVLLCDRENDRVQIFDRTGAFLAEWTDLQRPQGLVEGPDGLYYVAEGEWRAGNVSARLGPVGPSPSRVSVVAADGTVVDRIAPDAASTRVSFIAAHGIAMDSRGDVYVAEVSFSVLRRFPDMKVEDRRAVRKLRRVG